MKRTLIIPAQVCTTFSMVYTLGALGPGIPSWSWDHTHFVLQSYNALSKSLDIHESARTRVVVHQCTVSAFANWNCDTRKDEKVNLLWHCYITYIFSFRFSIRLWSNWYQNHYCRASGRKVQSMQSLDYTWPPALSDAGQCAKLLEKVLSGCKILPGSISSFGYKSSKPPWHSAYWTESCL